jgi:hypothetical protein
LVESQDSAGARPVSRIMKQVTTKKEIEFDLDDFYQIVKDHFVKRGQLGTNATVSGICGPLGSYDIRSFKIIFDESVIDVE